MIVEKRILNFEKLGFGLFIHFGVYSEIGEGEWVKNTQHLSDEYYDQIAKKFNPKNFNADNIVLLAKQSGCKYITFTARHHDGFSLYNTCGLSDFDTVHSCGRDLIKELVDACNKYDIMPILYHTTIDWRNKDYQPDESGNFKRYLKYLQNSIEILCKNYGKVGGFWFDGNWAKPNDDWEENELYGIIRKYQPEAMIINNTGLSELGKVGHYELDSVTFERGKPVFVDNVDKYRASEMCQIVNSHWGNSTNDINYKSMKELIENLVECRKFGANFLLNIAPKGDGSIALYERAIFEKFSIWTSIYNEAIYDCKPCEIKTDNEKDFVLKKNDKELYLFVHDLGILGDNNVIASQKSAKIIELKNIDSIKSIKWLDNNENLIIENNKVKATQFFYGRDLIVRVAKIEIK